MESEDYYAYFRTKALDRIVELDWTQQKLADVMGVPKQRINNLLRGRANPGLPTLANMERALRLKPGYLIKPGDKDDGKRA